MNICYAIRTFWGSFFTEFFPTKRLIYLFSNIWTRRFCARQIGANNHFFGCSLLSQAGIYRELGELGRNFRTYLQDSWNYLDTLGFAMLFGGVIIRLADRDSPWGRSLYALSAPLIFSRVLFFAQILKFQGSMIQVSIFIQSHRRQVHIAMKINMVFSYRASSETPYINQIKPWFF